MPEVFDHYRGIAAVLMQDNIDTDQIIPSREMKTVSQTGLGAGLFASARYIDADARIDNPDFVLNRPGLEAASILVSGANFGCGSSREHAVWALKEYGFRVIVAESFGEIFYGNCLNNGILPIALSASHLAEFDNGVELSVNLREQSVTSPQLAGLKARFDIDPYPKRLLLEGLDPIGLTLQSKPQIEAFFSEDAVARAWLYDAV